jgi:DNA processing protein
VTATAAHLAAAHLAAGHLAALAGFERMTTSRLAALLADRTPQEAFAIAAGRSRAPEPIAALLAADGQLAAAWKRDATRRDPDAMWARCRASGITVVTPGDSIYPIALLDDPRRPPVLFLRGDPAVLDARRVGIVGTRRATQHGREVAARLGFELADAGVAVVSGLALGIDGAAHRGVLATAGGTPIAVVGSGPDVVYPRKHASLWQQVVDRGLLISEWPPGTTADAFRFPMRNRILAALSEVVVVVESRESGGSLITAREAAERGVEVMAVPGPIDAGAAKGTNRLLRDGAAPVTEVDDVLMALGLDSRRAGRRRFDPRRRPGRDEIVVLECCRQRPSTLEQLVIDTGRPLAEVAIVAARLEHAGWLRETVGWFEAVDEWADLA